MSVSKKSVYYLALCKLTQNEVFSCGKLIASRALLMTNSTSVQLGQFFFLIRKKEKRFLAFQV